MLSSGMLVKLERIKPDYTLLQKFILEPVPETSLNGGMEGKAPNVLFQNNRRSRILGWKLVEFTQIYLVLTSR